MKDTISKFPARLYKMTEAFYRQVPSQAAARRFIDQLVNLLFSLRENRNLSLKEIDLRWENLQKDLVQILRPFCCETSSPCEAVTEKFFSEVPLIYTRLMQDAVMYNNCDPASHGTEEVVLCYPGFYAVMIHRFAHVLYKLEIPVLPRVLAEYAHSQTGIDIHPGATIGRGFYIDHGTGIVIGETSRIGRNVRIYQGVTLGATFISKGLSGQKRHPTIEDNVILYAGSTILGGNTVIGHDTVIGGNVWLTESVPPHSTVYQKSDIHIKENNRIQPCKEAGKTKSRKPR